ncbi:MAG: T9SS type A sorting domain-containing protein [Endomicrobium sp.]|jgi:hypothetical protein|nr:T9SS type A sorting domain-containing protein [Endomicrobium sp.]
MSKKLFFTILIVMQICGLAYAATLTPDPEHRIVRFSAEVSFYTAPEISVVNIFHKPIERVSVNMRTLVAVGTITLSGPSANLKSLVYDESKDLSESAVYLEYYTDEDTAPVKTPALYRKTAPRTYVFETVPLLTTKKNIYTHYRIIAISDDGTIGYYPKSGYIDTEHDGHTRVGSINSGGGIRILQSGDQRRGDTSVQFVNGALMSNVNFIIRELYTDVDPLPVSHSIKPLITYHFAPENISLKDNSLKPVISIYYGDAPAPDFNNIEVKWFNINRRKWENVSFSNNTDLRTATVNLAAAGTDLGYYAIFTKGSNLDEGFGPDQRVLTPQDSKITFKSLRDGDTVRIYNARGKVVKNITAYPFEWDKRDNNGNFVETGSYIYQIKVDGKTTSGTIVIVR